MRDFERRRPRGDRRARRIKGEKIAPDHQPGHVDRLEFVCRPRRHLLAVAQNRYDVGDGLDLFQAMGNVEDRDALGLQLADESEKRGRLDRASAKRSARRRSRRGGEPSARARSAPVAAGRSTAARPERQRGHRRRKLSIASVARRFISRSSSLRPRRASRPRNMFSAMVRSGASMISWWTSTMPRRSASTGPLSSTGAPSSLRTPRRRRQMTGDDLHQGRLAGAVLADDRVDLPRADVERHVAQDLDRPERPREPDSLEYGMQGSRGDVRSIGLGLRLWRARTRASPPLRRRAPILTCQRLSPRRRLRKAARLQEEAHGGARAFEARPAWPWEHRVAAQAALRPRIMSAAFSPIIAEGAWVLPLTSSGMIEASTTRRPSMPRTLQRRIDHGAVVGAHAAGPDRMVDRVGALADEPAQRLRIVSSGSVDIAAAVGRERRAGPGSSGRSPRRAPASRDPPGRTGSSGSITRRRRDVGPGEPHRRPGSSASASQTCSDMPVAKWGLRLWSSTSADAEMELQVGPVDVRAASHEAARLRRVGG